MTLFLCIHELCDPLNPSHLMYTFPFLRSTFFLRYVRMSSTMQLVLVERTRIFESSSRQVTYVLLVRCTLTIVNISVAQFGM